MIDAARFGLQCAGPERHGHPLLVGSDAGAVTRAVAGAVAGAVARTGAVAGALSETLAGTGTLAGTRTRTRAVARQRFRATLAPVLDDRPLARASDCGDFDPAGQPLDDQVGALYAVRKVDDPQRRGQHRVDRLYEDIPAIVEHDTDGRTGPVQPVREVQRHGARIGRRRDGGNARQGGRRCGKGCSRSRSHRHRRGKQPSTAQDAAAARLCEDPESQLWMPTHRLNQLSHSTRKF